MNLRSTISLGFTAGFLLLLTISLINPSFWITSPAGANAPSDPRFSDPDVSFKLEQSNGFQYYDNSNVLDYDVDELYYNVSVEQAGLYVSVMISFNPSKLDADLYLWAPNGTLLDFSNYSGSQEVVSYQAYTIANFTLGVVAFHQTEGNVPYELVARADDGYDFPNVNDVSQYEANMQNFSMHSDIEYSWRNLTVELSQTGGELPVPELAAGEYKNLVLGIGDTDFYRILLHPGNTLNFSISYTVQEQPWDLALFAYNSTGSQISNTTFLSGVDHITLTSADITASGYYYFGILGRNYLITNMAMNDSNWYDIDCCSHEDDHEWFGEDDPNDVYDKATNITESNVHTGFSHTFVGLLASNSSPDYYTLDLIAAQTVHITLEFFHVLSDFDLYFFMNKSMAANHIPLYWSNQSASDTETIGPVRLQENSTYYLLVTSKDASIERRFYNLTLDIGGIDDDMEENDGFLSPAYLPAKNHLYTLFSLKDDLDFFGIPLLKGDILTARIEFNLSLGNLDLYLIDQTGENFLNYSISNTEDFDEITWEAETSSLHVLVIGGIAPTFSWLGVDYNLTIDILPLDDCFEDNDDQYNLVSIGEGTWEDLVIRDNDDDWYQIYLAKNDTVSITASVEESHEEETTDIDLKVFYQNATGLPVASSVTGEGMEAVEFTAEDEGIYIIAILFFYGPNTNYTLLIDIVEADDIYEDNDNMDEATVLDIEGNATYEGLLIRTYDDDWYKVHLKKGYGIFVNVTFPNSNGNLDVFLFSEDLTLLAYRNTVDQDFEHFKSNEIQESAWYYIRVEQCSGTHNTYGLFIDIGPYKELDKKYPDIPAVPGPKKPPGEDTIFGIPVTIAIIGGTIVGGGAIGGGAFVAKKGWIKIPGRFKRGG